VTNGRELARGVLLRVEQDTAWANRTLSTALNDAPALSPEDRGLATELVYGSLRRQTRLDRVLSAFLGRSLESQEPRVRTVLRVAAYQVLFLSRIPAYAAVNEAVDAAKKVGGPRMGGFVNAVLRRLLREGEPALPDPARDLMGYMVEAAGMPVWLATLVRDELGAADALSFARSLEVPAPLWLRANALRGSWEALEASFREGQPEVALAPSVLLPEAFRGDTLARPFDSEAFRRGAFAVQDLGAQVVAHVCGAQPGERILDACAGHGGKTAHLAALGHNQVDLVAWDRVPGKISEAKESFTRLGVARARAEVQDVLTVEAAAGVAGAEGAEGGRFDRILLDAPCSGLGVLRRHPEALLRREATSLAELAAIQRAMLQRLAPWVAPGGVLTYAVCTFDRAETTDVVTWFLTAHPDFEVERPFAASSPLATLVDDQGHVRTWPWRDQADAFFAVRLRRRR
jgi:16S rRNA (cytosine967-C5)-methyltransferase